MREWLRITCARQDPQTRIQVLGSGRGEATAFLSDRTATLYAALLEGDEMALEIHWKGGEYRLSYEWPLGNEQPTLGSDRRRARGPSVEARPDAVMAALCDCHRSLTHAADCESLSAAPGAACHATYGGDCAKLLACSRGDPNVRPVCPDGQVAIGIFGRCRPRCGEEDCAAERCIDWNGVAACW